MRARELSNPGKEQRDVKRYREAAYRAVDQLDWLDKYFSGIQ
jgi:hypothetical protein